MKAWSAFYPDLLPELPGAPLPMVDHWLRNAAIEFCERSKAYVVDLVAMNAVASQMSYTLVPLNDTEIVELKTILFSGKKLDPKGHSFLENQYPDWTAEVGTPEYHKQQASDVVMLVPAPSAAATDAIKIKAVARPAMASAGVADWLFQSFRQALVAGCKAKMMAMVEKPWSNQDRVEYYLGAFEASIDKAMSAANSGFGNERPRYSGGFV